MKNGEETHKQTIEMITQQAINQIMSTFQNITNKLQQTQANKLNQKTLT